MNIVPHVGFSPIPMLDRLMQVARQNPNAVAHIQRLAQRYGPAAMAHVRQFLDHAGYRAGRAVRDWIGRHVRPRRNQFMLNARRALGRAQQTRIRRLMNDRMDVKSQGFSQVRRYSRGGQGVSRGVRNGRRGMGRRWPVRTGGRPYTNLRPELKYFDDTNTAVPIGNTIDRIGSPVVAMVVGSSQNNRVGRQVVAKSLMMTGRIRSNATPSATQAADTVWIWVIIDRQSNGLTAGVTDIWSNTTGHGALRNLNNGPRFKILKCFECKVDYGQSGVDVNVPFEARIPLSKVLTFPNGSASVPNKNNLLIFAGTSNSNNTTLVVDIYTRVRFYDC